MSEIISDGLTLTIPQSGDVNWESVFRAFAEAISGHSHIGSGDGAQLAANALNLTWTAWTPTYSASGSMTFAGSTVYADYIQCGKLVLFKIAATGTTGGVVSTDLRFTLPVNLKAGQGNAFSAVVQDPSGLCGFAQRDTDSRLYVRRYDSSNWSIGASRGFFVNGLYEAA